MKNSDLTKSDFVTDKMDVNLDMFGPLVMHYIGWHIDDTNFVTIDYSCFGGGETRLNEKIT